VKKKKILIIDDDPDFTEATRIILESADYEVVTARNGAEGLERVTLEDPDLIILDIMMETMFEGFSVCAALKMTTEYIDYRDTPILMISSVKQEVGSRFNLPKEAEGLEGDSFLDKPVEPGVLLSKVDELLRTHRSPG